MKNFKIKELLFTVLITLFAFSPLSAEAKLSNDPFVEQWSYKDLGVYGAWDNATGSDDVVVAIIDNGFDTFHPDLKNNVWKNVDEIAGNKIDDDNNGYIDDV